MGEMVSIQQSGNVSFRPHARLIRLLGDELISDEIMAVVELVKNGYDADASSVRVALDHVTDPLAGCISIRDDGDGMDLFTLLNVWMEPATSHKRKHHRNKQRTQRGRIFLGEKGVGRFAADKLGSELELVTRSRNSDREIVLRVFWHHFDNDDSYLEDVKNSWHEQEPVIFPDDQHGTLLTIRYPRIIWTEDMVNRLYNGLSRLISPFRDQADFDIEIDCPEFPSIQGRVVNRLLETSPYRLSGNIDSEGRFFLDGKQDAPVDLCSSSPNRFLTPSGEKRAPLCGPFKISLYVWDLDIQPGKGTGVDKARRDAIRSFCGVSIYRDGFRIWPYGERDDDWLELNQRRVNNPTLRVSNNQVIGFIEITHDDNPELKDRTSREGLIDTPAFFDLKALALAALSLLEAERFNQRHQVTISRTTMFQVQSDELLGYLSRIEDSAESSAPDLRNSAKELEKLYRQKLAQEQERYDRLSALAGVGVAAELLTGALTREINDTVTLLQILQGEANKEASVRVQELIGTLTRQMKLIHEQLDLTAPLYHPQQTNEPVNIQGAIYDLLLATGHKLKEANVRVRLECDSGLTVRISRGYLMQAMMIILTNAIHAMNEAQIAEPRITIRITTGTEVAGVLIANNGTAIPPQYKKLIFEPAFSMRQAGRGLGLHVARDLLATSNCSLELVEDETLLPAGACFRIRFDGRRVLV